MNQLPTDQTTNSYVDTYQPPAPQDDGSSASLSTASDDQQPQADTTSDRPVASANVSDVTNQSESLEDQNIFYLLGVQDDSDDNKEEFLDELQQVIWEDFLERDASLLLTPSEYEELQRILNAEASTPEERQEQAVVYLEKLIPDLEEVMLEKALSLKGDMFKERIIGLQTYYQDKPDALAMLDEAESLLKENKWHQAATRVNSLKS